MENCYANDFTSTVKTYYKSLKNCNPLTKEQEKELMKKAKNNDLVAKNKILSSNLKFVFGEAKKYKGRGVPIEDLISEGNLGLIYAFDKFDTSKNVKFFSYAVWWIKAYMNEFIKKTNKKDFYEQEDDGLMTTNVEKINEIYDEEDETCNVGDVIMSNEEDMATSEKHMEEKELTANLLDKLDDRERQIIEYYFGLNGKKEMKLEEIGEKMNLSKERVRQIKTKSLLKLKSEMLLLS